ncbi:MAG: hypothetical protein CL610_19255 [Anaerolineaceae bacterium]|nr:hypothetical protein [Anaerolineaceae bacterium]
MAGTARFRIWFAALALVGCASAATGTPLPTLTLIPPTATYTPTPVTPTATRVGLPGPADLFTATPEAAALVMPVGVQPLLERALDDLAERQSVDAADIQVVRLETAVWTTLDFDCGDADSAELANLEIDGYRIVLDVEGEAFEYHADTRATVRLCESVDTAAAEAEDLLLELDPVAADTVALAQRNLANRLDLPVRRIRVVDVMPVLWPDNSLGCPQPNQTYTPIAAAGYRIVLSAGDETYIFHSDSIQVIACSAENEVLPIAE